MRITQLLSAILIAMMFISCGKNNDSLNWNDNLENAIAIAQKENKPILVDFTGSDWCQWCIKLSNEVFSKEEFKNFADENLVLVKLDFPRSIKQSMAVKEYNNRMLKKFGVRGFPTIIVLDKNGNQIQQTGYQPGGAANYINHLKSIIG